MGKRRRPGDVLAWVTVAATLFFGLLFVYYWRAGYSSDTVLTGLMAKNVIERGERPIFLWHFGYHGVIPNVYLTALFFEIFGVGPRINLMFTLFTFWGLTYVVFKYLEDIWGRAVAQLAVLVFVISSSELYLKLLRSEPGYTEVFTCGMLFLFLWRKAVVALWLENKRVDRRLIATVVGVGFFAGFGFYVYELMAYFLAVVVAQVGCLALHDAFRGRRWQTPWDHLVLAASAGGLLAFADGLWAFARKVPPLVPFNGSPIANLELGVGLVVLTVFMDVLRRHVMALARLWPAFVALAVGVVVGLSPKLYFKYVEHGVSLSRTGLDGNVDMFLQRLRWAWKFDRMYLNVQNDDLVSHVFLLLWGVVLSAFAVHETRRWVRFAAGKTERDALLQLDPLALLPWVVLPAFGLSAAVYDWVGARYTVVLYLYFALAAAWALHVLMNQGRSWMRHAGWVAALSVALFNCKQMAGDIQRAEAKGFDGEETIEALRARNVHYGYGEYWVSYMTTFVTNEDIILQPMTSAYAPAYGPIVAKADRLAIVDRVERMQSMRLPGQVNGKPMQVVDAWKGKTWGFYVLQQTK